MDDFLQKVEDILETEESLTADMELTAVENWDSLSIISFLAMVDIEYDKVMKFADFKEAKTFGDLYQLVMHAK